MAAASSIGSAADGSEAGPRSWVREHGSPLLVLDCAQVRSQFHRLSTALPSVEIFYAMKALPHPAVIAALNEEGSRFDVSSPGEIGILVSMGISPARAINTHPIKRDKEIRDSLHYGCRVFVVDNAAEMQKFVAYRDQVSLLLRVGFRSPDALVDLAKKFGCAPDEVLTLLELGRKLDLPIVGLSFHVGSQCQSPGAHVDAIDRCRSFIDEARRTNLASLRLLDIGGGFPVPYSSPVPSIETFCAPIRRALDDLPGDLRIVAEPGRYLTAPAMQGIATVIGKARRGEAFWYYLDDGVYGSFNGRVYDPAVRYPLRAISASLGQLHRSVLAGPTCDSIDIIAENVALPELQIGDLIVGGSMGAYTAASASEFNSLPRTKIVTVPGAAIAEQSGSFSVVAVNSGPEGADETRANATR